MTENGSAQTIGSWSAAPRRIASFIRYGAITAIAVTAFATPGFTTAPALLAWLNTMTFVGCVAVGMTFITVGGNIMSFSLGATVAATAFAFVATLPLGLVAAIAAALVLGMLIALVQGFAIGYIRANPIIVSIAALALIYGTAQSITGAGALHAEAGGIHEVLKVEVAGLPLGFVLFVALALIGQLVLTYTRFGRNVHMVGSSLRAAQAAGIETWRTVTGAYIFAGACAAVSGVLLAGRYGSANMEFGTGYDYDAIAAVLVGGTPIRGGEGSMLRTFLGVAIVATVQVIVLLRGFRQEWQYLITGLIVLSVIMLQTLEARR